MKIRCYTIFDITKTNINSRRIYTNTSINDEFKSDFEFNKARNQQINFETILQIISMRSQPEEISTPICNNINIKNVVWIGADYSKNKKVKVWNFEFSISHPSVYMNNEGELGNLLLDCVDVPMVTSLDETENIFNNVKTLQISNKERNILFEIINKNPEY